MPREIGPEVIRSIGSVSLGAVLVTAALAACSPGGAPTARSTTGTSPMTQAPSASPSPGLPSTPTPAAVESATADPAATAARPVPVRSSRPRTVDDPWRLARTPQGYAAPVLAGHSSPEERILQYLPAEGEGRFGERISVVASSRTIDEIVSLYERLGRTTVRADRAATHFRIGDGAGARQALVWDEGAVRVAVYAFEDLRGLAALAEQVQPCGAAC